MTTTKTTLFLHLYLLCISKKYLIFSFTITMLSMILLGVFPLTTFAQSPTDPNSDITWDEDKNTPGNQNSFIVAPATGCGDELLYLVEAAFNNGRRAEEIALGLPTGSLGDLSFPSNYSSFNENEKILFLINQERTIRGGLNYPTPGGGCTSYSNPEGGPALGLPLEGYEMNITQVATEHVEDLVNCNVGSHTSPGCAGSNYPSGFSPPARIQNHPVLGNNSASCTGNSGSEFIEYSENIAYFSGPDCFVLERAVYIWVYQDAGSYWGHRHTALIQNTDCYNGGGIEGSPDGFNNNHGPDDSEGFIGVAVGGAADGSFDPYGWGASSVTVVLMNIFDPVPDESGCGYIIPVVTTPTFDDCNGVVDPCGVCDGPGASNWYQDTDGDGLGDPNTIQSSCDQPAGFVANSDDDNDACNGSVDVCGVCNGSGESIWYQDLDSDGLGDPNTSQSACEQPAGYVSNANDDADDCNGVVDECGVCNGPGPAIWYHDGDGDGLGDPNFSQEACEQPATFVSNAEDDNDTCSGVLDQCGVCDGDGSTCVGCPDASACNYNSNAIIDDGSCDYGDSACSDPCNVIPGCTNPSANNYESTANCEDGSCNFDDLNACPLGSEYLPIDNPALYSVNCFDGENNIIHSCNHAGDFTPIYDLEIGQTYCFSSDFGTDDFFSIYPNNESGALISGPADGSLCWVATTDSILLNINLSNGFCGTDETCRHTYISCPTCPVSETSGCNVVTALNYDPSANCDDGSCQFAVDTELDCFPNLHFPEVPVIAPISSVNCFDEPFFTISNENHAGDFATIIDLLIGETYCFTSSRGYLDYITLYEDLEHDPIGHGVGDGSVCITAEIPYLLVAFHLNDGNCGTDDNPRSTFISCSTCDDPISGCNDPSASNYNPDALCNDGSCIIGIGQISGCTDPCAPNYDPAANLDNGSCDVYDMECNDDCSLGNITTWDAEECTCITVTEVNSGCTDPNACNFDPAANCDDGSCDPCLDCDLLIVEDLLCGVEDEMYQLFILFAGVAEVGVTNNLTGEISYPVESYFVSPPHPTESPYSYTLFDVNNPDCSRTVGSASVSCISTSVELFSFEGEILKEGNLLKWSTATETDSESFILEKAFKNGSFEKIAEIRSNENSNTLKDYAYSDVDIELGTSYYRLLEKAIDGSIKLISNVVSLNRKKGSYSNFEISPIPSNDFINVKFEMDNDNDVLIKIFNISGQLVESRELKAFTGEQGFKIDISQYPSGNYFLQYVSKFEEQTVRFIRN